ncbi:MAG: DUF5668 domain-containing protein [Candidatus Pacebacteria bacterium]|nr:DUF5668 domain-containing protein [Candidatus Paceibacterota bacterium]
MPKRVFWPAALVTMGLIFLASNLGLLPLAFWNLWPIILIVVGLGGLLLSDKEDWDTASTPKTKRKTAKKTTVAKKKTTRKKK